MRLHTPTPRPRDHGDFAVRVNPGDGEPFALIQLDESGSTDICLDSLDDADRLIRAAMDAKRKLEVSIEGGPHEHRPGDGGDVCAQCGQFRSSRIHLAAARFEPVPRLQRVPACLVCGVRPVAAPDVVICVECWRTGADL